MIEQEPLLRAEIRIPDQAVHVVAVHMTPLAVVAPVRHLPEVKALIIGVALLEEQVPTIEVVLQEVTKEVAVALQEEVAAIAILLVAVVAVLAVLILQVVALLLEVVALHPVVEAAVEVLQVEDHPEEVAAEDKNYII